MLRKEEWEKLAALLKSGLIDKRMFNMILDADDPEQAEVIIVKLLAEKLAMVRTEESELPELTKLIAESIRAQFSPSFEKTRTVSIGELLEFSEKLLTMITEKRFQDVSIILCPCAWEMIGEFYGPPKTLLSEKIITVTPRIKNIFIKKNAEVSENILMYLSAIPDISVITDPQEFIEKAENTMVICRCIGSKETELIELLCCLLAKGIFLVADQKINLRLSDLIAFKQAIDGSPVEENQGVIYLKNELLRKPFDPSVSIAAVESHFGGKGRAKKSEAEDVLEEALQSMIAKIFSGPRR